MFLQFLRYFAKYIFFSKTRQRLLFLAIVGLFISSFALMVLQSTMGGLQTNLINRSKSVVGSGVIILNNTEIAFAQQVLDYLNQKKIQGIAEYEIELLLRNGNFISPAIVHGIDPQGPLPDFLKVKNFPGTILGSDLARKIQANFYSQINMVSPSHTNSILGDVPRQVTTEVNDLIMTEVSEVDLFHLWTRLSLVQNLIRERSINRIRLFAPIDDFVSFRMDLNRQFGSDVEVSSWEDMNSSLVWALNLETTVMLGLFIGMTFLIAISITSGFLVFFEKIKLDLVSFWIMGSSKKDLDRMSKYFLHVLSFLTCSLGILLSLLFLFLLKKYGGNIMPDIFVERSIPVLITTKGVIISFFIPYSISVFFSHFSLALFSKDEESYIDHVRAIG